MIKIEALKFYPGAYAGLSGKTALATLQCVGRTDCPGSVDGHVCDEAVRLLEKEPFLRMWEQDLPGFLLVEPCCDSPAGRWLAALTVAFQRWARDPVGEGRVVSSSGFSIELALPWEREAVLRSALQFAIRYLHFWLQPHREPSPKESPEKEFSEWLQKVHGGGLSPNTLRFAMAARLRGIPSAVSSATDTLRIGWGSSALHMDGSFTGNTGVLASRIARNKMQTGNLLRLAGVPVPPSILVHGVEQALTAALRLGWPVVVKPPDLDFGQGVVPDIRDKITLQRAFESALKLSRRGVIVEKHVAGQDHRMLVVGGELLAAAMRIPPGVTGDGRNTVAALVDRENADFRRSRGKRSLLIALSLDNDARRCLQDQGLVPESVPEAGRFVFLGRTANVSTGGSAVDVTSRVHPDNRRLAERAVRLVGLDIAGVDFLCPDISRSWRQAGGWIIEVNAQPGFRPHWIGDPGRDINGEIIDRMFRSLSARIPTAAISGTNGKSTTALMLHHIWTTFGKVSGVCTTNGVWVGSDMVSERNLSGYPGGRILLEDPAVETAVFEMPRKGLILFGHPCDRYDVAALLNVQNDHIGVDGIGSLEEMARLKAEVLERAAHAVVVNAEDSLCLAMLAYAGAPRHVLVSRDATAFDFQQHLGSGGPGVFCRIHEGTSWIVLAEGMTHFLLMPLQEIPATMNGLLQFNEINALFAAALAWAQGIPPGVIRKSLATFANTAEQNPGRYNFIEGFPFRVLLDYAHNPEGIRELCGVAGKLDVAGKRRLLNQKLGCRHRSHLAASAFDLARTFDDFVLGTAPIYVDKNPEWAGDGDPQERMITCSRQCLLEHGVAPDFIVTERDQANAIRTIMKRAEPGDLVVLMAEPWVALQVLQELRDG